MELFTFIIWLVIVWSMFRFAMRKRYRVDMVHAADRQAVARQYANLDRAARWG